MREKREESKGKISGPKQGSNSQSEPSHWSRNETS